MDIYLYPITSSVRLGAGIELKYIKRDELTDSLPEVKTKEGLEQLKRYELPANAVKVLLVFHGWELARVSGL